EYRWQPKERKRLREADEAMKAVRSSEQTPAEQAAATADAIRGQVPKVPEFKKPEVREQTEAEAERQVGVTAKSKAEAAAALEAESKRRPYVIDFFDEPSGPFFVPEWAAG